VLKVGRFFAGPLMLALALSPQASRATSYPLPSDEKAIGEVQHYVTRKGDTLLDVARSYDLGYAELITANRGIDPWIPGAGRHVTIPTFFVIPDVPRQGIVVNLAQRRLFYFPPGGGRVETYPLGVGVQGRETPVGTTRVVGKQAHPFWYPPPSILSERPELPKVVPPGPDNPLGDYAFALGWPLYLIHGTNRPYGVGRNVSHGCLHLYPEDMAQLFEEVPVGAPVRMINEEASVAWIGEDLYVAAYPNQQQTDQLSIERPFTPALPPALKERIAAAAGDQVDRVDWDLVKRAGLRRTGIPIRVTLPLVGSE
jgi:L,D-transpeptidase ErfK/SrfK